MSFRERREEVPMLTLKYVAAAVITAGIGSMIMIDTKKKAPSVHTDGAVGGDAL
jgi:hypothetical protein